jgi:hypothetical protein
MTQKALSDLDAAGLMLRVGGIQKNARESGHFLLERMVC